MDWLLAALAFFISFFSFFPLYRYFWRLIWRNGDEFAPAYKKDYGKDLDSAIVTNTRGMADIVADRFVYASLAVFIVPLIPHALVATGLFFLLRYWLG